jgi:uncharacterized protein DUF4124
VRAALCIASAAAIAVAAQAEMYRCVEPGGAVRFTSDPRACGRAAVHEPAPDRWLGDAPAAPAAPAGERATGIFPPPPSRWQVLVDPPESPDDEERALGLLGSAARHYTHAHGAVSQVCTLELWSFAQPIQAARARDEIAQPGWWGRTAGAQLVLAHGVRLERNRGSRPELSADCRALAEAAHARALATLRTK